VLFKNFFTDFYSFLRKVIFFIKKVAFFGQSQITHCAEIYANAARIETEHSQKCIFGEIAKRIEEIL